MVLGLGNDLVNIHRIEKTLERFGVRFLNRVFTAREQAWCEARAARVEAYAKRFAVKEACAKALGTGLSYGVFWKDMELASFKNRKPELLLHNGAQKRAEALANAAGCPTWRAHVSMSDDLPYAHAVVILEALTYDPHPLFSGTKDIP